MENIIDMSPVVNFIFQQISIVITLSALLVGINNKLKEVLPSFLKLYMSLFSIAMGIWLMFLLRTAFLIETTTSLTVFYGLMIWLGASWLYDAWLGKSPEIKEVKESFIAPNLP